MFEVLLSLFNNKFLLFTIIINMSYSVAIGQTISNLDIFYFQSDSIINEIISERENFKQVYIEVNFNSDYSLIRNRMLIELSNNDIDIMNKENDNTPKIFIVIEDASVIYDDMSRDGLFGSYYISRKVTLKGNYILFVEGVIRKNNEFKKYYSDRISYETLQNIEYFSLPFTQGEKPTEPFLLSIVEPFVAIGTAAVAIILFFTIRSK